MRQHVSFLFLLITVMTHSLPGRGCSCTGLPPDFFRSVQQVFDAYRDAQQDPFNTILFVKGTFTSRTQPGSGVRFLILEKYYGRPTTDTLKIWGSDGNDCRLSVQSLYKGNPDTAIFILNRNRLPEHSYEDTGDYYSTYCLNGYLTVHNDSVFGGSPGASTYTGLPLPHFEDSIRRLIRALDVTMPAERPSMTLLAYPNPAKAGSMIDIRTGFSDVRDIHLYAADGRQMPLPELRSTGSGTAQRVRIGTAQLLPGCYVIRVTGAAGVATTSFTILE